MFYSGKVTLLPVKTMEDVGSSPEEPAVILSPILKYKNRAVQKCVEMSQGPNDLKKKFDFTNAVTTTDDVFEDTKR